MQTRKALEPSNIFVGNCCLHASYCTSRSSKILQKSIEILICFEEIPTTIKKMSNSKDLLEMLNYKDFYKF